MGWSTEFSMKQCSFGFNSSLSDLQAQVTQIANDFSFMVVCGIVAHYRRNFNAQSNKVTYWCKTLKIKKNLEEQIRCGKKSAKDKHNFSDFFKLKTDRKTKLPEISRSHQISWSKMKA